MPSSAAVGEEKEDFKSCVPNNSGSIVNERASARRRRSAPGENSRGDLNKPNNKNLKVRRYSLQVKETLCVCVCVVLIEFFVCLSCHVCVCVCIPRLRYIIILGRPDKIRFDLKHAASVLLVSRH